MHNDTPWMRTSLLILPAAQLRTDSKHFNGDGTDRQEMTYSTSIFPPNLQTVRICPKPSSEPSIFPTYVRGLFRTNFTCTGITLRVEGQPLLYESFTETIILFFTIHVDLVTIIFIAFHFHRVCLC